MSHVFRSKVASISPARSEGEGAPDSRPYRAAGLPFMLMFVVALAAATLAVLQLDSLENDHLPALRDAQHLDETVEVMGVALHGPDFSRADSLADHFHAVATTVRGSEARQSEMRGYDASFGDYYVSARRAAEGTSMSDEADLSSSESAKLASGVLKERLDAGIESGTKVVESTSAAALKIRIAGSLLLALIAAIALYRFVPRRPASKELVEAPIQNAGHQGMAEGGKVERRHLQEAVWRMTERRLAVAQATAQVAERNRQQVALLQREQGQTGPTLTVIRGEPTVLRTPRNTRFQPGKRAVAGV
jgi:hypothetical protein